jgi:hypothetical protein
MVQFVAAMPVASSTMRSDQMPLVSAPDVCESIGSGMVGGS